MQEPVITDKFSPKTYTSVAMAYAVATVSVYEDNNFIEIVSLTPSELKHIYKLAGYTFSDMSEVSLFYSIYEGQVNDFKKTDIKSVARAYLLANAPIIYKEAVNAETTFYQ